MCSIPTLGLRLSSCLSVLEWTSFAHFKGGELSQLALPFEQKLGGAKPKFGRRGAKCTMRKLLKVQSEIEVQVQGIFDRVDELRQMVDVDGQVVKATTCFQQGCGCARQVSVTWTDSGTKRRSLLKLSISKPSRCCSDASLENEIAKDRR